MYSYPEACSQCQGVTPRIVKIVEGVIQVDGVPHGVLTQVNKERQAEETTGGLQAKRRKCGRCGTPGHYASTCNVGQKPDDLTVN